MTTNTPASFFFFGSKTTPSLLWGGLCAFFCAMTVLVGVDLLQEEGAIKATRFYIGGGPAILSTAILALCCKRRVTAWPIMSIAVWMTGLAAMGNNL